MIHGVWLWSYTAIQKKEEKKDTDKWQVRKVDLEWHVGKDKHLFLHTVEIVGLNMILELIKGLVQSQVLQSVVRVRLNHWKKMSDNQMSN